MIFAYLCLGVVSASVLPQYFVSPYDKRTLDFDDPRLFSAAFGKRSDHVDRAIINPRAVKRFFYSGTEFDGTHEKRDYVDPRFLTSSFGKRSRSDLDERRFLSMSIGKQR